MSTEESKKFAEESVKHDGFCVEKIIDTINFDEDSDDDVCDSSEIL